MSRHPGLTAPLHDKKPSPYFYRVIGNNLRDERPAAQGFAVIVARFGEIHEGLRNDEGRAEIFVV
jgi:hypothetical protein